MRGITVLAIHNVQRGFASRVCSSTPEIISRSLLKIIDLCERTQWLSGIKFGLCVSYYISIPRKYRYKVRCSALSNNKSNAMIEEI